MAKPDQLDKLIKEGVLRYGNDPALQIVRISSRINSLDELLGGGLPKGKILELYGPQSTGKTLIAQYIACAVQQTELPDVIYFDMEDSFDQSWWDQSGVDTSKLLVTSPTTGEQAIDIMIALLQAKNMKIGLIIVDSIAAMSPQVDADPGKSAEEKTMGSQAKMITLMFHKVRGLLGNTIFLLTNQMRSSLGSPYNDEISALPGGWANKHFTHILLRTRKENWLNNEDGKHTGFNIEVVSKKNKLATTADGESIIIPYNYKSQIEFLMAYLDEAEEKKIIARAGPYFKWESHQWAGRPAMREYFRSDDEALEKLKDQVHALEIHA